MNRTRTLHAALAWTGLVLAFAACNPSTAPTSPEPAQASIAKPKPQPSAERVMERSAQRWAHVCAKEWVETYDFLTPEQKRVIKLPQYLQSKDSHVYENARPVEVLKLDGADAFIRATAIWTPQHPMLAKVKLEPGQTLTQELEMIETWRFDAGDWHYVQAQRPSDFYADHPEFLKRAESADAQEPKGAPAPGK